MVCTGCTRCKKCTQVVSNMRETSEEGLTLCSTVRRWDKEKTNVVFKYWLQQGNIYIVIKLSFCVDRYVRPKSVEKGRSAKVRDKIWKRELVNTLVFCVAWYVRPENVEKGRSATAQGKMWKRDLVKTMKVSMYIVVGNISAAKMNKTGKGDLEGTMDVDGSIAGGSQGKKNVSTNYLNLAMSSYANNIVTKLLLCVCAVYPASDSLEIILSICIICALFKNHNRCQRNVKSCRVVVLYIWIISVINFDKVSGNRLYKTVAQAFIEWAGRYGE
jgi:hypothetical protein